MLYELVFQLAQDIITFTLSFNVVRGRVRRVGVKLLLKLARSEGT